MPDLRITSGQPVIDMPLEAVTQFWAMGERDGDCLLWPEGKRFAKGYGSYWHPILKKTVQVHRLAFFLTTGELPPVVRHSCDTPPCFAPEHLLGGTHADNVADRVSRARSAMGARNGAYTRPDRLPRGEDNGNSRLTAAQVVTIRSIYVPGRQPTRQTLADQYGVSKNTIDRVLAGKWGASC